MKRFVTVSWLFAVLLAGCESEEALPVCDAAAMTAANEIVFLDAPSDVTADDGLPMYAGQALIQVSCGSGAFCHSPDAESVERVSVPKGFDFVLGVPCQSAACASDDPDLLAFQHRVEEVREEDILEVVEEDEMPPGPVGEEVVRRWFLPDDPAPEQRGDVIRQGAAPWPSIESQEGIDMLKAWLACGAPVVQTARDPGVAGAPGDSCAAGAGDVGDCVVRRPAGIDPIAPTWDELWTRLFEPLCAESCHGENGNPHVDEPELLDKAQAYQALLEGEGCGDTPQLIDPGNADGSALIHILLGDAQSCTDQVMPPGQLSGRLPDETIDAVKAWINAGALQ